MAEIIRANDDVNLKKLKELQNSIAVENRTLAFSEGYENAKLSCPHCLKTFYNQSEGSHNVKTCEFVRSSSQQFMQSALPYEEIAREYECSTCEGKLAVTETRLITK
ncbi:MAG: hypothetical protein KKF89_00550 [Nanoarchaeota archaeon]|nr:hypothetical protein [Nanoarchaeota archaeon]MBU1854186.1 hypothetical protein [Nanoarchaeota archaeon]